MPAAHGGCALLRERARERERENERKEREKESVPALCVLKEREGWREGEAESVEEGERMDTYV